MVGAHTGLNPIAIHLGFSANSMKGVGNAIRRTSHDIDHLNRRTMALSKTQQGLNALYYGFGGLGIFVAIRYMKVYVDIWTEAENRAKIFGKTLEKALVIQEQMYQVAQQSRLEFDSSVKLYARLAIVQADLRISLKDVQNIVRGVGKALIVSGTNALQARGALIQFTQALGSGIVRAEEMNAMLEGSLRIVQAVARNIPRFEGSVPKLRKAVIEGQVTSQEFLDAFLKGIPSIEEEFDLIRPTLHQGFVRVENSLIKFAGTLDKATNFSETFAKYLFKTSDHLKELGTAIAFLTTFFLIGPITRFFGFLKKIFKYKVHKVEEYKKFANMTPPKYVDPPGRHISWRSGKEFSVAGYGSAQGVKLPVFKSFGDKEVPIPDASPLFQSQLSAPRGFQTLMQNALRDNAKLRKNLIEIHDEKLHGPLTKDHVFLRDGVALSKTNKQLDDISKTSHKKMIADFVDEVKNNKKWALKHPVVMGAWAGTGKNTGRAVGLRETKLDHFSNIMEYNQQMVFINKRLATMRKDFKKSVYKVGTAAGVVGAGHLYGARLKEDPFYISSDVVEHFKEYGGKKSPLPPSPVSILASDKYQLAGALLRKEFEADIAPPASRGYPKRDAKFGKLWLPDNHLLGGPYNYGDVFELPAAEGDKGVTTKEAVRIHSSLINQQRQIFKHLEDAGIYNDELAELLKLGAEEMMKTINNYTGTYSYKGPHGPRGSPSSTQREDRKLLERWAITTSKLTDVSVPGNLPTAPSPAKLKLIDDMIKIYAPGSTNFAALTRLDPEAYSAGVAKSVPAIKIEDMDSKEALEALNRMDSAFLATIDKWRNKIWATEIAQDNLAKSTRKLNLAVQAQIINEKQKKVYEGVAKFLSVMEDPVAKTKWNANKQRELNQAEDAFHKIVLSLKHSFQTSTLTLDEPPADNMAAIRELAEVRIQAKAYAMIADMKTSLKDYEIGLNKSTDPVTNIFDKLTESLIKFHAVIVKDGEQIPKGVPYVRESFLRRYAKSEADKKESSNKGSSSQYARTPEFIQEFEEASGTKEQRMKMATFNVAWSAIWKEFFGGIINDKQRIFAIQEVYDQELKEKPPKPYSSNFQKSPEFLKAFRATSGEFSDRIRETELKVLLSTINKDYENKDLSYGEHAFGIMSAKEHYKSAIPKSAYKKSDEFIRAFYAAKGTHEERASEADFKDSWKLIRDDFDKDRISVKEQRFALDSLLDARKQTIKSRKSPFDVSMEFLDFFDAADGSYDERNKTAEIKVKWKEVREAFSKGIINVRQQRYNLDGLLEQLDKADKDSKYSKTQVFLDNFAAAIGSFSERTRIATFKEEWSNIRDEFAANKIDVEEQRYALDNLQDQFDRGRKSSPYSKTPAFLAAHRVAEGTSSMRIREATYVDQIDRVQKAFANKDIGQEEVDIELDKIERNFPEFQTSWENLMFSMEDGITRWGNLFTQTLTTAFATGKLDFKEFIKGVIVDLIGMVTKAFITEPIFALLKGALPDFGSVSLPGYGGAKAGGGSIMSGGTYLVGEEGPELFVANQAGYVVPNDRLSLRGLSGDRAMGGRGNVSATNNAHVTINIDSNGSSRAEQGNFNSNQLQAVGSLIAIEVNGILADQLSPGGMLNRG